MDESIEYLRGKQSCRLPCCLLLRVSHCSWLPADAEDPLRVTDQMRSLGLMVSVHFVLHGLNQCQPVCACACHNSSLPFLGTLQVCRGTAVMMVSPTSGTEEIENPFLQD